MAFGAICHFSITRTHDKFNFEKPKLFGCGNKDMRENYNQVQTVISYEQTGRQPQVRHLRTCIRQRKRVECRYTVTQIGLSMENM